MPYVPAAYETPAGSVPGYFVGAGGFYVAPNSPAVTTYGGSGYNAGGG